MPVKEELLKGASGRISFDRINRHFISVPKHVGRDGVEGVEGYSDGPCGMRSHLEAYLIHTEGHDQERFAIRREQPVPGTQGVPYGVSDTRHRGVFPFGWVVYEFASDSYGGLTTGGIPSTAQF